MHVSHTLVEGKGRGAVQIAGYEAASPHGHVAIAIASISSTGGGSSGIEMLNNVLSRPNDADISEEDDVEEEIIWCSPDTSCARKRKSST